MVQNFFRSYKKRGVITMKIKQQKQIKAFLIEEFRKDRGSALFDEQEKALNTIIKNTKNKSKAY